MRALAALLVACAGCTNWSFGGNTPTLPLVGSPPIVSTLPKLNDGPVTASAIVYGADGAYWLALEESTDKGFLRAVRLSDPIRSVEIPGTQFTITWRNFFAWQSPSASDPAGSATLTVVSAAQDPSTAWSHTFADGQGGLIIGGADDVLVYEPPQSDLMDGYTLLRVGAQTGRTLPFPGGSSPELTLAFFSGDGDWFLDREPCALGCGSSSSDDDLEGTERRSLTAHAVDADADVALGLLPRRVLLYQPTETEYVVFSCGSDGVGYTGWTSEPTYPVTAPVVLDETACASDLLSLDRVTADGGDTLVLLYMIGDELRYVPIDGSGPPTRVADVPRVLAIYALDFVVYSTDSEDKYIYGVGDGWVNGWKFMNRGRAIARSADQSRMYFLENAAQDAGVGLLSAAPINGKAVPLAENVYQYDLLDDGRLLAAANHVYVGPQNRIVAIDEKKGVAQWVIDQATEYDLIPASNDILADVVTGASSYDIVRVPLPAPEE